MQNKTNMKDLEERAIGLLQGHYSNYLVRQISLQVN